MPTQNPQLGDTVGSPRQSAAADTADTAAVGGTAVAAAAPWRIVREQTKRCPDSLERCLDTVDTRER